MPVPMLLKSSLKVLALVAAGAALLLLVIVNFSPVESRSECTCYVTNDGECQPLTLYAKVDRFHWSVSLWSDSYGDFWVEVPSQTIECFNHIRQAGDQLQLMDDDLKETKNMRGNFSTLSKYLSVKVAGVGFFDGSCKRSQRCLTSGSSRRPARRFAPPRPRLILVVRARQGGLT